MSPAHQLLETLQREENLLLERRFDALADVQRRKETLLSQMKGMSDADLLARIQKQASRNEKLMSTALTAIRGLKARFTGMGQASGNVGYARDGSRMGVEDEQSNRRV